MDNHSNTHHRIDNETDIQKFYNFKKVLGQGAFGVVHLAEEISTNQFFACKTIKKTSGSVSMYEQQEREVGILRKLNHVNICKLVAVYECSKSIALILELCEGGELVQFLRDRDKGKISESISRSIVTQLVSAVSYLHRNRIIHRDIKPENILIKSKNELVIKMADFGLACYADSIFQVDNIAGTPLYMAPEIVQKQGYNQACDIWSIGIMLYLLLCNYQKSAESALHSMVKNRKIEYPDKLWKDADSRGFLFTEILAMQLAQQILRVDPAKRISAGEILTHPWVTNQVGISQNNVLDLMKSYNAELRLRKAIVFVRCLVRFKTPVRKSTVLKDSSNKPFTSSNFIESSPILLPTSENIKLDITLTTGQITQQKSQKTVYIPSSINFINYRTYQQGN